MNAPSSVCNDYTVSYLHIPTALINQPTKTQLYRAINHWLYISNVFMQSDIDKVTGNGFFLHGCITLEKTFTFKYTAHIQSGFSSLMCEIIYLAMAVNYNECISSQCYLLYLSYVYTYVAQSLCTKSVLGLNLHRYGQWAS